MKKILSALIILLACSLILPTISATPLSDLGYTAFSGEGEIAMVGNIELGLIKGNGYFVVPTGSKVISLDGNLISLNEYKQYLGNYTIEGYGADDIDIYSVSGVVYILSAEFIGFKGNALDNGSGIIAKGTVQHYVNGDWTQQ